MDTIQEQLLQVLLRSQALTFGDFTLKSGRRSPYFINLGTICSGFLLAEAGRAYAACIKEKFGDAFDTVFGPAYKGIPLAVSTCTALSQHYGIDKTYASDRKEEKTHGDKGRLLGAPLKHGSKIVFIDDVISAGTSLRQAIDLLHEEIGCTIIGAVVAFDRQEQGKETTKSALAELQDSYGLPIHALLNIRDVFEVLHNNPVNGTIHINDALYEDFIEYQKQFGAR